MSLSRKGASTFTSAIPRSQARQIALKPDDANFTPPTLTLFQGGGSKTSEFPRVPHRRTLLIFANPNDRRAGVK
jgi:hypothetical protein